MSAEKIMEQAQVFASAWSVVGGPFDGGDAMEMATQEKAELKRMVAELAAERDALTAKLAEMEGQEPVAWVEVVSTHEGPYNFEGMALLGKGNHLLYARPVPAEPVNARLLTALKACRNKLAHDAAMVAMADVAIMDAEAAPKVARLTHPDIAKALASAGLMPEDYREDGEILPLVIAIEAAALRKNGIEAAE